MTKWDFFHRCKAGSIIKNQCNLPHQHIKEEKSYDHIKIEKAFYKVEHLFMT